MIAEKLKHEIHAQLISEKTGMYLLNLDNDGNRHHDITGDLIFPVLFGVSDHEMQQRILHLLTGKEMWTPFGSCTVHQSEQNYDPDFGYQLVGGIWHNLTVWIAYCIRDRNPEMLVEGMKNMYRLSEIDTPREYGYVVPGQFPERMHGETYRSRGMAMSPWMPPTYLWLGIEGLLGVKPSIDRLEINPSLPASWQWIAVKNLLYKNETISLFVDAGTLYTTYPVESKFQTIIGTPVDTSCSDENLFSIGILAGKDLYVFVAADRSVAGTVVIELFGSRITKEIRLKSREAKVLQIPASDFVPKTSGNERASV